MNWSSHYVREIAFATLVSLGVSVPQSPVYGQAGGAVVYENGIVSDRRGWINGIDIRSTPRIGSSLLLALDEFMNVAGGFA